MWAFVLVGFIINVLGFMLYIGTLSTEESWPKTIERGMGWYIAASIMAAAWSFWAGILLFS